MFLMENTTEPQAAAKLAASRKDYRVRYGFPGQGRYEITGPMSAIDMRDLVRRLRTGPNVAEVEVLKVVEVYE